MLQDIAGWVALAATCIAALMTASNVGARVTGWGFVVFTVGAVAWIVVGVVTGQTQLLWSNIFLALVDLFGIWRWLVQRTKVEDTTRAEEQRSAQQPGADLFAVSKIDGMAVTGRDGDTIAYAVDALTTCEDGRIGYIVIREGGIAGVRETLRRLPWSHARVCDGAVATQLDAAGLARLPVAKPA